jgi:hypothetical protein
MNVEMGAEAAQFPEKEYVNGIAVAVQGAYSEQDSIQLFFVHKPPAARHKKRYAPCEFI